MKFCVISTSTATTTSGSSQNKHITQRPVRQFSVMYPCQEDSVYSTLSIWQNQVDSKKQKYCIEKSTLLRSRVDFFT